MSVLEGTAALARAGLQPPDLLTCGQLIPQDTPQPKVSNVEMEPGRLLSLFPVASSGAGTSLGGEENSLATGGEEAVLQFQVAEQEGAVCRQAVLALSPLQIFMFRGHCMEAGPRVRQPLHVPPVPPTQGYSCSWVSP